MIAQELLEHDVRVEERQGRHLSAHAGYRDPGHCALGGPSPRNIPAVRAVTLPYGMSRAWPLSRVTATLPPSFSPSARRLSTGIVI